jgi:hypothetical protein
MSSPYDAVERYTLQAEFEKRCDANCKCPNWEKPHLIRYGATFRELLELGLHKCHVMLDCGGPSPFRTTLREMGFVCEGTDEHGVEDLRYAFAHKLTGANYNWVIALEVLEHLADREVNSSHTRPEHVIPEMPELLSERSNWFDWLATFNHTGQVSFLLECKKLLAPQDSCFIVSTPNANGWCSMYKMFHGDPPHMWDKHVRELSEGEAIRLITLAGLRISKLIGLDIWPNIQGNQRLWRETVRKTNLLNPGVRREDCLFFALTRETE